MCKQHYLHQEDPQQLDQKEPLQEWSLLKSGDRTVQKLETYRSTLGRQQLLTFPTFEVPRSEHKSETKMWSLKN